MGKKLNKHTYEFPAAFFNAGSIGRVSQQAEKSTKRIDEIGWTELNTEVQRKLAAILDVDTEYIRNFYNTTAAIQRVFTFIRSNIGNHSCPLLTTDEEYPGIVSLLDEVWPGTVYLSEISNYIWNGMGTEAEKFLLNSCQLIRPSVVYLSHVTRTNGFKFRSATIKKIRQINPSAIIIIDGAQAVGNTCVEKELLEVIDFYITSGHKWIGGKTSLGLIYTPLWQVAISDPAQSYSRKVGSGGTGIREALLSFITAADEFLGKVIKKNKVTHRRVQEISENNRNLAKYFIEKWDEKVKILFNYSSKIPKVVKFDATTGIDNDYRTGIVTIRNCPIGLAETLSSEIASAYSKEAKAILRKGHPKSKKIMYEEKINKMKYSFTKIESELWRMDSEGMPSGGSRYLISKSIGNIGYDTIIRELKLFKENRPHSAETLGECLRFCFHVYHEKKDVNKLINSISKSVRKISDGAKIDE